MSDKISMEDGSAEFKKNPFWGEAVLFMVFVGDFDMT